MTLDNILKPLFLLTISWRKLLTLCYEISRNEHWEFPGGPVVKDLVLSLLWLGFSSWPGKCHMPWTYPKEKKKKRRKKRKEMKPAYLYFPFSLSPIFPLMFCMFFYFIDINMGSFPWLYFLSSQFSCLLYLVYYSAHWLNFCHF